MGEKRREENEKTMATMAARECAKRLGFGLGLRQIGANTPLALVPATQTQGLSNAATASSSFSSSASCCSFSSRSRACVDRNSKGSVSSRVSGLPFVNGGHAVRGLTTKTPDDKGAELLESLEHATGLELAEKEGKARGIDIFTEGEAWLSAPFGTPEKPVVVTSSFSERIVGVTDPEDDSIVVWDFIKEGEPPKQIVENGEYFVLKKIENQEDHFKPHTWP